MSKWETRAQEHPIRCIANGQVSCLASNELKALGEDERENGPWPSSCFPRWGAGHTWDDQTSLDLRWVHVWVPLWAWVTHLRSWQQDGDPVQVSCSSANAGSTPSPRARQWWWGGLEGRFQWKRLQTCGAVWGFPGTLEMSGGRERRKEEPGQPWGRKHKLSLEKCIEYWMVLGVRWEGSVEPNWKG